MKNALYRSLFLHLAVLIIFLIDMPRFWHNQDAMRQVPIIVDLNKVKISEMTNLPPKAEIGKEDKQASNVKRKVENYTTPEKEQEVPKPKEKAPEVKPQKPEPVVEEKEEPKSDYLVAPQPKKPQPKRKEKVVPVQKPRPKPKAKPQPKAKDKKAPELANPLKSLLASVDSLEKSLGEMDETAQIKEGTEVNNMGIEGGTGGSYFSELSISEIDAIAGRLRACWNLDPGAKGAQNMIVELRAYLSPQGEVERVDILDTDRYGSDTYFRSVAESARRAVFVCAPYKIFVEKYGDQYDMWKTMLLRFNPLDASIQ